MQTIQSDFTMFDLDTMYTVYQAGDTIVSELANRNGNHYSKDGTGKRDGAIIKGGLGR